MPLLRLGITGGAGCGKSAVAARLKERNMPLIDVDTISHELTVADSPLLPSLIALTGPGVLAADGQLDRAALRARIFTEPELRQGVEALLHPEIRQRMRDWFAQQNARCATAVIPLLIEAGWQDEVDRIWVVTCPPALQQKRLMQRTGMDAAQAKALQSVQACDDERLPYADAVLNNHASLQELHDQVDALHPQLLS